MTDEATVVLHANDHLRAVAYVYRDGSGRCELQRKLTPRSEWKTEINEPKTKEWMQEHTLIPKEVENA